MDRLSAHREDVFRPMEAAVIAGVDGCKSGWVAVLQDDSGRRDVAVFSTFADLLGTSARLMVIDVPIGIMTAAPRAADGAARSLLRHRACCVFSAPYRAMLAARSHQEACSIRGRIDGKRCSRQAFEITSKIAEVDAPMTPELQERVREGHPEVTFAVMNGGVPMEHAKKSAAGGTARIETLRSHFPEIEGRAAGRRPTGVGRDDLLDAYAMLWTAGRIEAGVAQRVPPRGPQGGQRDDRGVRAEIWA